MRRSLWGPHIQFCNFDETVMSKKIDHEKWHHVTHPFHVTYLQWNDGMKLRQFSLSQPVVAGDLLYPCFLQLIRINKYHYDSKTDPKCQCKSIIGCISLISFYLSSTYTWHKPATMSLNQATIDNFVRKSQNVGEKVNCLTHNRALSPVDARIPFSFDKRARCGFIHLDFNPLYADVASKQTTCQK